MTFAFATVNGYRLRYRVEGEGPPAVFGHGLLGSLEQVEELTGSLAPLLGRLRLLVYDARGHGESEGPEDPALYTWEQLGRDMSALAATAGLGPAVFGGGSMGAATALWVALERPEEVRALVLVMPPPLGHPHMRGADEQQALAVLDLLSTTIAAVGLERTAALARALPGFAPTPEEAEERAGWLLGQNPRAVGHAIRGLLESPYHDPECYRTIGVPTLVMAHEGDGLHPVRSARLLAGTIAGARLRVGPEADYWQKHPKEFLAEVTEFVDAVG
ncbi:MAG: alpha/beta hydrolase [Dehalococcoidia bacterium]|nr:alpha/beta hydrolase [Dehalococcoidia bacterium]